MVTINLWASLTRFTDGAEAVEVDAATVSQALKKLTEAHPGLGPILDTGVAVVINGEVVPNLHRSVEPDDEIFLIQQMKGG